METGSLQVRQGQPPTLPPDKFMQIYNPDAQSIIAQDPAKAFTEASPVMATAIQVYGRTKMLTWLTLQLARVAKTVTADRRMSVDDIQMMAEDIVNDPAFRTLRIAEIMLFLAQYRAGRFGKVYGTLNSINLCVALRDFLTVRAEALDRLESKRRATEREMHDKEAITYEEYCRRAGIPPTPIAERIGRTL